MNQEFKKEWVAALRSGEFEQDSNICALTRNGKYCCLGVATELLHRKGLLSKQEDNNGRVTYGNDNEAAYLPQEAMDFMGLDETSPTVDATNYAVKEFLNRQSVPLSTLNDQETPFELIAQIIEEQL